MKITLFAFTAILLTGCSSNLVWYKPGVTNPLQIHQDYGDCKFRAQHFSDPWTQLNVYTAMANNNHVKQLTQSCMEAKGYFLMPSEQVPPGQPSLPK